MNYELVENTIIDEIEKRRFLESLEFFDLDLMDVFTSNKTVDISFKEDFNDTLRKINRIFGIPIIKSVLFIESNCATIRTIFTILDNYSIFLIKKELGQIKKSRFDKFFIK